MAKVIDIVGLTKSYGRKTALRDVELSVPPGRVLGLLGPNGAGKTTLVRILSTLLPPDSGRALVAGHDVVRERVAVRRSIGLVGQYAAIDETLTGRENLYMVARLYRLGRREARTRADEALERLSLADVADRPARTYSGGMRRRLDLGASLVGRPPVLLLDEPTTGLDPVARIELWEFVRGLVKAGSALLLTTQMLDEADELADEIAILDHGSVIAQGRPEELKSRMGDDRVDVTITDAARLEDAAAVLASIATSPPATVTVPPQVSITVRAGSNGLTEAVRRLDDANVGIADVTVRRPSLDDVFLALTGNRPVPDARTLSETGESDQENDTEEVEGADA